MFHVLAADYQPPAMPLEAQFEQTYQELYSMRQEVEVLTFAGLNPMQERINSCFAVLSKIEHQIHKSGMPNALDYTSRHAHLEKTLREAILKKMSHEAAARCPMEHYELEYLRDAAPHQLEILEKCRLVTGQIHGLLSLSTENEDPESAEERYQNIEYLCLERNAVIRHLQKKHPYLAQSYTAHLLLQDEEAKLGAYYDSRVTKVTKALDQLMADDLTPMTIYRDLIKIQEARLIRRNDLQRLSEKQQDFIYGDNLLPSQGKEPPASRIVMLRVLPFLSEELALKIDRPSKQFESRRRLREQQDVRATLNLRELQTLESKAWRYWPDPEERRVEQAVYDAIKTHLGSNHPEWGYRMIDWQKTNGEAVHEHVALLLEMGHGQWLFNSRPGGESIFYQTLMCLSAEKIIDYLPPFIENIKNPYRRIMSGIMMYNAYRTINQEDKAIQMLEETAHAVFQIKPELLRAYAVSGAEELVQKLKAYGRDTKNLETLLILAQGSYRDNPQPTHIESDATGYNLKPSHAKFRGRWSDVSRSRCDSDAGLGFTYIADDPRPRSDSDADTESPEELFYVDSD
jgi:hypothetical protein